MSAARGLGLATSAAVLVVASAFAFASGWSRHAPLPAARTEVAAAVFGTEIAVAGGFSADGKPSVRVDAYSPEQDTWRRLPDLPVAVHHAMAAGAAGKLYVLGGYGEEGRPLRTVLVLAGKGWRLLPRLPSPRAAAGAAVVRGRIVVAGGVTRVAGARLARRALSFDLRRQRWSFLPGPTPREHLGVAASGETVYAVAGRTSGLDTNLSTLEAWSPGARRWKRLPPVPRARGGTGAAAVGGRIVSVGGEEPGGTIDEVYAYRVAARIWRRLPNLPTARHGLGVVGLGGSVFVIGGGPQPGLTVSDANESLRLSG